jgi:hypothetical protein
MSLDLRQMAIVTIGPLEPALLLVLALACVVAWLSGRALATLTFEVRDPWRRRLLVGPGWMVAGLVHFLLPDALLPWVYPLLNPDFRQASVCVAMVWPLFLLPAIVVFVAGWRCLRALRRAGVRAVP